MAIINWYYNNRSFVKQTKRLNCHIHLTIRSSLCKYNHSRRKRCIINFVLQFYYHNDSTLPVKERYPLNTYNHQPYLNDINNIALHFKPSLYDIMTQSLTKAQLGKAQVISLIIRFQHIEFIIPFRIFSPILKPFISGFKSRSGATLTHHPFSSTDRIY